MKKFHITIKNNETGEVELDLDAKCIMGAAWGEDPDGDEATVGFQYINCNGQELHNTVGALKDRVTEIYKVHPELKLLDLLKAMKEEQENREKGDEEQ